MGTFKVIIAGSRTYADYSFIENRMDHLLQNVAEEIEIVSGGAKGADYWGEQYAKKRNYRLKRFPANWDEHGKLAGFIRNEQMAQYANACVIFMINESTGSRNMESNAKKYKLKLRVYKF